MSDLRALHLVGATGKPRTEWLGDREYLVVPTVALIGDNVIHAVNASEAEFVPASLLTADGWSKRPLMLGHPVRDGVHIAAGEPSVLEAQSFGFTDNARVNGKRLGVESWCDVKKLEALGQQAMLADLRAGKNVEVSTGSIVQTRPQAGMHNGKRYATAWATLSADHLAFLPTSKGACSVEMGCGANRAAMRVMQGSDDLQLIGDISMKSIIDPETLKCLRDIPQSARDEMSSSDFAGPDESFPIKTQADVDAAKHLIGKAANPDAVKAKVIAIAKRKGLTIPDAWKSSPKAAQGYRSAQLFKMLQKFFKASEDGSEGDESGFSKLPYGMDEDDERAEAIAYDSMKSMLGTALDQVKDASSHLDELIADPTLSDEEEDARLNAIRMAAYSAVAALNNVCSVTYEQQTDDDVQPGTPAYLEGVRALLGKSISAANMKVIQAAHDASHDTHNHTVALGAQCNGMKLLEAAAQGEATTFRAACSCSGGDNMTTVEKAAALKTLGELRAKVDNKDVQLTEQELKALEMTSDNGIARLRDLAGKSPADAIIQAKSNADAALAAHAHGLNAKDQAAQAAADADKGGDQKLKAAQAAGFKTVEEHEKAEFYAKNPEIKALVDGAIAAAAAKKVALIETLKTCGALNEEQLKVKTVEQLEELAAFARVPKVDYSGMGFPRAAAGADDVYANPPDPYAEGIKQMRAARNARA